MMEGRNRGSRPDEESPVDFFDCYPLLIYQRQQGCYRAANPPLCLLRHSAHPQVADVQTWQTKSALNRNYEPTEPSLV